MGEIPLFTVLDNPFVLDIVLETKLKKRIRHEGLAVAEDMKINIEPLAHVPGSHAARQSGPESRDDRIKPRIQPHISKGLQPLWPLVDAGHRLDLVADIFITLVDRRACADIRRQADAAPCGWR